MSLNRKDWLNILGLAAAGAAGAGMFGLGPLAGILGPAEAAAAGTAPEVAGAGMFNMVPGVTSASPQHMALLAQNAGMGGTAADLTAQAAQTATGKAGFLDTLANTAKADLAGMNDPGVWLDRLGRNADRFAGNMGKSMATGTMAQALMGSGQGPQPVAPPPRPQGPSTPAPDPYAASNAGGPDLDALAMKLGVSRAELEAMLDKMGRRA